MPWLREKTVTPLHDYTPVQRDEEDMLLLTAVVAVVVVAVVVVAVVAAVAAVVVVVVAVAVVAVVVVAVTSSSSSLFYMVFVGHLHRIMRTRYVSVCVYFCFSHGQKNRSSLLDRKCRCL